MIIPPGPAEYATPGGEVRGILESKWQYIIRGGQIKSMFDTSLTIGDEILQQALGNVSDKQMHSIVATIQAEQNQIIRHDRGRLLIVQGAAGSGKTSAALQRIAYLLYKYRDRLKADQIILFSPNSMFNSYVSNVLPELGEENMQQVTFQEYLDHRLSNGFQVEGPYEQLEYVLTAAVTLPTGRGLQAFDLRHLPDFSRQSKHIGSRWNYPACYLKELDSEENQSSPLNKLRKGFIPAIPLFAFTTDLRS